MRLLFALAVLVIAGVAHAETKSVPLGAATVQYDATVWRAEERSGIAALSFTCVAADCPDFAAADVTATKSGATCEPLNESDETALALLPGTPLPFTAKARWSGCRAQDTPILAACAEKDGVVYRVASGFGGACNFLPGLPEERFLDLLHGISAD
ncbi:MAG: hypothetical protein WDM94_11775 [Bauldia sp.]